MRRTSLEQAVLIILILGSMTCVISCAFIAIGTIASSIAH